MSREKGGGITRRDFLKIVGLAGGATLLSACSKKMENDKNLEPTAEPTQELEPTPNPTAEPTVEAETLSEGVGEEENEVQIEGITSKEVLQKNIESWLDGSFEVDDKDLALYHGSSPQSSIGLVFLSEGSDSEAEGFRSVLFQGIYLGSQVEENVDFPIDVDENDEVVRGKIDVVTAYFGLNHPLVENGRLVLKTSVGALEPLPALKGFLGEPPFDYRVSTSKPAHVSNTWKSEPIYPREFPLKLEDNVNTVVLFGYTYISFDKEEVYKKLKEVFPDSNMATVVYIEEDVKRLKQMTDLYEKKVGELPSYFSDSATEVLEAPPEFFITSVLPTTDVELQR